MRALAASFLFSYYHRHNHKRQTDNRKKHTAETVVPWLLLFGIFGIALLRCAMIAFVEVSSFGIGTSTMYLATVPPLLAVYAFTGLFLYGRPIGKKRKDNA